MRSLPGAEAKGMSTDAKGILDFFFVCQDYVKPLRDDLLRISVFHGSVVPTFVVFARTCYVNGTLASGMFSSSSRVTSEFSIGVSNVMFALSVVISAYTEKQFTTEAFLRSSVIYLVCVHVLCALYLMSPFELFFLFANLCIGIYGAHIVYKRHKEHSEYSFPSDPLEKLGSRGTLKSKKTDGEGRIDATREIEL